MTNQTQNKRDSFIFYRSFFEATESLKNDEKAQLFDAICSYALDNKFLDLDGTAKGMFGLIKPQLDANRKRFENGCKKKQNLSKTEAKEKQNRSKREANVNVNEECKSELELKSKFKKPTIEEIKNYCLERKNNVDANNFFDFYQTKGWKVGNSPMKDWQACVRTWERRSNQTTQRFMTKQEINRQRDQEIYAEFLKRGDND
jgi:hypothetical protein